jgi:hypothetical protein
VSRFTTEARHSDTVTARFRQRWMHLIQVYNVKRDGVSFSIRPRSFPPDWPVPDGMLRPVSNPDANGNMRSFRPGLEPKLASLFPVSTARSGTRPPALRIGSGSCATTRAVEQATAGQRGAVRGDSDPTSFPFLVLLAGDPLALPFVLVVTPSSRVLESCL